MKSCKIPKFLHNQKFPARYFMKFLIFLAIAVPSILVLSLIFSIFSCAINLRAIRIMLENNLPDYSDESKGYYQNEN